MELMGKTCLITGGLSGIGAATARLLASRGANIAIVARSRKQKLLDEMRRQVEDAGCRFLFIKADAGSAEDCERSVRATCAEMGTLDVLIHAAGSPAPGGLFEVANEDWQRAFDVHVHAVYWLCRAAVPIIKCRGEGAIVLVASAAGLRGCKAPWHTALSKERFRSSRVLWLANLLTTISASTAFRPAWCERHFRILSLRNRCGTISTIEFRCIARASRRTWRR